MAEEVRKPDFYETPSTPAQGGAPTRKECVVERGE